MYPKAEEIFSEKESMIGILGKKTELEEYLPILKLFYREGENLFSDVTIPAQYSVDGKEYIVNAGESIIMPSRKPHSVYAIEQFKMMLVVVFPS